MVPALAGDLNLLLPLDADVTRVLETLERTKRGCVSHLEDFTVVAPTLTDVFWELEQLAAAEDEKHGHDQTMSNERHGAARTAVTLADLAQVAAPGASFWSKVLCQTKCTNLKPHSWNTRCGESGFVCLVSGCIHLHICALAMPVAMHLP